MKFLMMRHWPNYVSSHQIRKFKTAVIQRKHMLRLTEHVSIAKKNFKWMRMKISATIDSGSFYLFKAATSIP